MLRFVEMESAEGAKAYYTSALARSDYYADGQEIVGTWLGIGACRMGIEGKNVERETFAALIDNRHPLVHDQALTPRTTRNRRPGYDLSFQSPKGLSVMAALMDDPRIYEEFRQAVRDTMAEMERSMQVRVRVDGTADENRTSGNWVYGEFMHLTARPTGPHAPDPHLHIHCCAMNASFDPVENRWKAGQFGGLKRDAGYYESAFHARLARAVADLGYRVIRRGKGWDLADAPITVIDKFSKRKNQIEKVAEERGITDAKARDRLGAETRTGKRKGLSAEKLKLSWLAQLSAEEIVALRAARDQATNLQAGHEPKHAHPPAGASVAFAVAHVFERQSVSDDKRLAEEALRHGVDQGVEVGEVWRELERLAETGEIYPRQVDDHWQCTTKEAYAETSRCIDFTREGMGRFRALAPNWQIRSPELLQSTSADQRNAIEHVLRATNRVVAVRGKAGTGKTFATQEIAVALKAADIHIQALAPTSKAADVLRQEGFANADTVSQMLVNGELQASVAGGVMLIDEAGLLSTRQLDQLFRIARERNCRVLIQYDLGQHRGVERGSPVRDLERYAGLKPAEIHVVRRQKPEDYKAAVSDLSRREYSSAFRRFADMGIIVQMPEAKERARRLAEDYLAATRKKGATALIVSPTHREGDVVTRAVRSALRADGQLKEEEHEVQILRRLGWTDAERGQARKYEPGQIIQYNQNISEQPGQHPYIERGARLVVKERTAEGKVLVEYPDAGTSVRSAAFELTLSESKQFDVYESKPITLSIGDRVRITQNGYVPVLGAKDGLPTKAMQGSPSTGGQRNWGRSKAPKLRLINNSQYQIARFTKQGDPVLHNGWVLPRGYGHFAYGYCTTSHASQGMTTDTVLISQASESLGASSSEQFYVSCSRGRTGIKIYTDSVEGLIQAVRRSEQQPSAADLVLSPFEQGSVPTPVPKRKSIRSRLKEQFSRVIDFARSCRNHLRTGTKEGTAQILTEGRKRLAVDTNRPRAVLTEESNTRRRSLVRYEGELVCGPYLGGAEQQAQHPNFQAGKRGTSAEVASPIPESKPRTVFVPMFDPELPDQSRAQSI